MDPILSAYQGCLLGLAVGDAMGVGIDAHSLEEIRQDYGPDGLLGYDLANGFAEISAYTQVAAFAVNGLLVGMSRGKLNGPYLPQITAALKEWARSQYFPKETEHRSCWLCHEPHMRKRKPMDSRTLDAFTRDVTGSLERPANSATGPGTLPAAVCGGLVFHPDRMKVADIGLLGAQTVALTHGDRTTILCGAVVAYTVAGLIQDRETGLAGQFSNAIDAVAAQFAAYPEAEALQKQLKKVLNDARLGPEAPVEAMERLCCISAVEVLSGAMYASVTANDDFDSAMIIAINHSGKSAATGALTGAFLGARLGLEALPEFYLDCLQSGKALRELSADLHSAVCGRLSRYLFDDDWDRKYTHGLPVDPTGWEEEE